MREREQYLILLKKLATKRVEANFTQYDVASFIGLTESGYFKIEKGQTKLDLERLFIILKKLGSSPKEFFKDFE